jgi:pre-mRNA-splicing factor ISY1
LEKLEGPAEAEMRAQAAEEWKRVERVRREAMKNVQSGEVATAGAPSMAAAEVLFEEEEDVVEEERKLEQEKEEREKGKEREFVAHVPLPDEKEIEKMVLERKKRELLSKYTSEGLLEEQQEAKEMLNVQQ